MIDIKNEKITWVSTGDSEFILTTVVDGAKLYVRLNDFPEEAMYTLILNNLELLDFDDWPSSWIKP